MKKRKFKFGKQENSAQDLQSKQHGLQSGLNPVAIKPEGAINSESPQPNGYMEMTTLKEIDAQLAALQAQREEIRKNELKTAVDKVRSLVAEYGLSESDVFPPARGARSAATSGTKVAPKYRDPATGQTWTGRGKAPKWIQGQNREQFVI